MRKKELLFTVLTFLLTVTTYSQKVTRVSELNVIVYNTEKKNFNFYKKVGDNQYQEIFLTIKLLIKSEQPFQVSKIVKTLQDLHCKNCNVIKLKDLKEQEESIYLKTINTLHKGISFVSESNIPNNDYVFASINHSLFFLRNVFFYYKTQEGIKGERLGAEFQRTFYYQKMVLKIAENKHITLLIADNRIVGCYMMFKNQNQLVLKFKNVKECINLTNTSNKNLSKFDTYFLASDGFNLKNSPTLASGVG